MSRQTDELLLHNTLEQEDKESPEQKLMAAQEKDRARDRLRALLELRRCPGYHMLLGALQTEQQQAFLQMDKTDNPTKLARHSGEHYATTMALGYVDNEIMRLEKLLA